MLPRAPSLQTLGLMVKNTIHKTKKMSLRYFFNGAMPSEQTENNIKIAQVRLSSSSKRQPRLSCARACASWLRAGGGVELRGGAGVGERGHRGVRDEQDHAAGAEEEGERGPCKASVRRACVTSRLFCAFMAAGCDLQAFVFDLLADS